MTNDDDEPKSALRKASAAGAKEAAIEAVKVAAPAVAAALTSGSPAAAAVAAALAPIAAAFGLTSITAFLNRDLQALQDALHVEQLRAIADVAPRLEQNFKALKDAGHAPTDGDVAGAFAQWTRVWMAADPKLRSVLKHAFAAYFDPDLYEAGIATDLLRIIEHEGLNYGDLKLLAIVVRDEKTPAAELRVYPGGLSADINLATSDMKDHHIEKLEKAGLLVKRVYAIGESAPVEGQPGAIRSVMRMKASGLGKKLAQLIAEANLANELAPAPKVDEPG